MKEERVTGSIKPKNNTMDILKRYFSNCFDKSGEFSFDKFKRELSQKEVNFSKESYSLEWVGKSYARVLAVDETNTLLRENEDFNQRKRNRDSKNLLIKGDNLEVLKHLTNAYYEKIKMIYIDPPYNTGKDGFVYQDNRKFSIDEFSKLAGVEIDEAKRILDFVDSKSNSHSAWLTFIYPRLYIARHLLREDGVIFISIDDNEVAQLKLLMDEIFGEENFVAQLVTVLNLKGNNDKYGFAETHEYTLVYNKIEKNTEFFNIPIMDTKLIDKEWKIDSFGYYKVGTLKAGGENGPRNKRPNLYFPIYINRNTLEFSVNNDISYTDILLPISNNKEFTWRWSKEKIKNEKHNILVTLDKNNNIKIERKIRPKNNIPSIKPKTLFYKPQYSSGNGIARIKKLFNGERVFPNPKPLELIKDFIRIGMDKNDLILDFFAGSGTTGDAVMQLNAEDGGSRRYILVQLPEPIDPKKNKIAFEFVRDELNVKEPTIFNITKERLIRASKRVEKEIIEAKIFKKQNEIKELEAKLNIDNKDEKIEQLKREIEALESQDLGFKIFETIPLWENYKFEANELSEDNLLFDKETLEEEELKALLITWKTYDGVELTSNFEIVDLNGYRGYYIDEKLYLVYRDFKIENLKALLEKIDSDDKFNPALIVAFGYHFESKSLREISENIKSYSNKKSIDIDFIIRY